MPPRKIQPRKMTDRPPSAELRKQAEDELWESEERFRQDREVTDYD